MTNYSDGESGPEAYDMAMQTEEFEEVYSKFLCLVVESNLSAEQISYLCGFIDNVAPLDLRYDIEERRNRDA